MVCCGVLLQARHTAAVCGSHRGLAIVPVAEHQSGYTNPFQPKHQFPGACDT